MDGYRALAAAILLRAVKDAQECIDRADALEFLASHAAAWLCESLNISPAVLPDFLGGLEQTDFSTWLSFDEAARAGGFDEPWVLGEFLRGGKVPGASKVGRKWLIPPSALPVIEELRERRQAAFLVV